MTKHSKQQPGLPFWAYRAGFPRVGGTWQTFRFEDFSTRETSTIPIIMNGRTTITRLRACPRDELTIDVVAILECSACAAWTLYLGTVGRAVSVASTLSAVYLH